MEARTEVENRRSIKSGPRVTSQSPFLVSKLRLIFNVSTCFWRLSCTVSFRKRTSCSSVEQPAAPGSPDKGRMPAHIFSPTKERRTCVLQKFLAPKACAICFYCLMFNPQILDPSKPGEIVLQHQHTSLNLPHHKQNKHGHTTATNHTVNPSRHPGLPFTPRKHAQIPRARYYSPRIPIPRRSNLHPSSTSSISHLITQPPSFGIPKPTSISTSP